MTFLAEQHFAVHCRLVEPIIRHDEAVFLLKNTIGKDPFLHLFLAESSNLSGRFSHYEQCLPPEKLAEIRRKRNLNDRIDQLAANGFLYDLLERFYIDKGHSGWKIHYALGKKPTIQTQANETLPPIAFNLSHSKGRIAIAISCCEGQDNRVGVDIEQINPLAEQELVAKQQFSAKELEWLQQSRQPLNDFYLLWTRREAFLKALGWGFSYQSESPNNCFMDGHHEVSFTPYINEYKEQGGGAEKRFFEIISCMPFEQYYLSVALRDKLPENYVFVLYRIENGFRIF